MTDKYILTPSNPPNKGILFANLEKHGRSGHMGLALVEYAPGKILAFYPNCSAEDQRLAGHSGYGWMEYKCSVDGGETWSDALIEPNSKRLYDTHCGRTQMCEKAICTDSGRIVLFYLTCDIVTNGHIWEPYFEPYYAFSEDGGETFTAPKVFVDKPGRVYDVLYRDGIIYVLFFANPELPGLAHTTEHEMQLYVSEDNGESFTLRSVIPFQSMLGCFYGTMVFTPEGKLLVYTYDENDEHNLKYIISEDNGFTWGHNKRSHFAKRLRNPQLIYYHDQYFIHGRSGSMGENPGHFILYTSIDGIHWDEGQFLRMQDAGTGAYSNNLIVHLPDGRERLMIQTSHAYSQNKTNTILFWIDAVSMLVPHFVTKNDGRFSSENRLWQSAPSAAVTKSGRVFCVFSADNDAPDELTTNYSVCGCSDDNGKGFRPVFYAYHDYNVRMSETLLFLSPEGRLYHFWTQSYQYFDGRGGIWCSICEDPDAETPIFGPPHRICDGFMADNPTILSNGKWIFPASVWTHIPTPCHPLPDYEKVSVWESNDCGKTLTYVGGVTDPAPSFTENTVFEAKDGKLVMLFRTRTGINRSESPDGGKTWSQPAPFVLPSPSSRFMVSRFPSGALLIVTHYQFEGRNNLTALISDDDGETFCASLLLDGRSDVSYPSGNMSENGVVTLAYDRERTGAREVLLASFTEKDIRNGSFGPGSYTGRIVSIGGKEGSI